MAMEVTDWVPPSEAELKLISARRERSDKISKLMAGYLLKGYKMLGVNCSVCDTILLQDRQGVKYCVACSELDSDTDKDDPLVNESAAESMAKEMGRSTCPGAGGDTKSMGISACTSASPLPSPVSTFSSATTVKTAKPTSASLSQSHVLNTDQEQPSYLTRETPVVLSPIASCHLSRSSANFVQRDTPTDLVTTNTKLDSGFQSCSGSCSLSADYQSRKRPAVHVQESVAGTSEVLNTPSCVRRLLEKMDWAGGELQSTGSVEYSIQLCQLIKAAAEAVVAARTAQVV